MFIKTGIPKQELLFSNKALLQLIWPLIIEQLLNITLGIADIVMVASLGEASVSGVSLVDAINLLLTQIFTALGTGGAVVAAQYIGRQDGKMAARTAKQLIYTVLFASFVVMTLGLLFHTPLLRFVFGQIEVDVMTASQRYFVITMLGLPGIALYSGCAALFRAQGNSRVSMLIAVLINILNIGGNALFIYGLHWGVEGVALPTFISRTAAAVILMVLLYRDTDSQHDAKAMISIKGITKVEIDFSLIKKILSIGIPNGLENSSFQIGKVLVLSIISTYGTIAIAANAAANTLASFECLPGQAIGLAMLTVVGQCIGANRTDQAVYYTKKMMGMAYFFMWVLNVPLLLNAHFLLSFYHLSPETTRLALYTGVWHGCCALLFWPPSFTLPNALRAANDAGYTMIVALLSMWIVRVGVSYLFKATDLFGFVAFMKWPVAYGAVGVWVAMILDWIVRDFAFILRFAHGKWKNRHLI
ncbi:MAG: MATE family efflux transporter [Treponema sp.]|nr:MATE family efflux transporter [Treponema sp.]